MLLSLTGNNPTSTPPGVGYILIGGALVGSQIRDIRLANELARRGGKGHVWWAMDWLSSVPLDPAIRQQWLFQANRNAAHLPGPVGEAVGRLFVRATSEWLRARMVQRNSWFLRRQMVHLVKRVCDGVEGDAALIRRFARQIDASGVDYLLPNLAIFAPYVAAARRQTRKKVGFTVTFQGYELYSRYAREIGLEQKLFQRFRDAVTDSDTPAVAVSEDYRQRVHADIGIPLDEIVVIPPGIPEEPPLSESRVQEVVSTALPGFDPEVPMVSYVGRQDSEKGIDLLLYAARLLHSRGVKFQLAICGGTAFGGEYALAIRNMADQLQVPVLWHEYMSHEVRTAIFQASYCTVYPSIHREPFGMVPVESMMLGTPAVVADSGGVAELVHDGEKRGGLTFRSWDSADLAEKLQAILKDQPLHAKLKSSAHDVAARYSAAQLADRTLALIASARS